MNHTTDKNLTETDLIEQATNGDASAFGQLYEKYIDQIYSYIYYRTSGKQEAEDLTSRVFLRALRAIEDYEDRGYPFSAWLYRIAHNLVVNWYRNQDRVEEVPIVDQYPPPSVEAGAEKRVQVKDEREELMEVIRELPEDRQQLIILKHVEGLTNQEIGEIMGRTEGAIKALYHRTLVSLRDEYGVLD
ncbi:MAG: sigma-70 family RNA polymerase sigma factor [Anaerolineales bacterium]|nr:sigma-70 family RNA polymerase sigma factor [Anaerolineales bacterium]MBS3753571.1 sigma-70 family RNA polymerase sigma factor [Anaerolineales bacterium]